jgi:Rrf2 family protein
MLSATAEHALRAVLFVAQFPEHTTIASDTVAVALGAPRNYLAKTLNALAKVGVLRSSRGPGGGFSLAVPAEQLTIAQVIGPFTEQSKSPVCLLHNRPCDTFTPCGAHAQWNAIRSNFVETFAQTTIADLLVGVTDSSAAPGVGAPSAIAPKAASWGSISQHA